MPFIRKAGLIRASYPQLSQRVDREAPHGAGTGGRERKKEWQEGWGGMVVEGSPVLPEDQKTAESVRDCGQISPFQTSVSPRVQRG